MNSTHIIFTRVWTWSWLHLTLPRLWMMAGAPPATQPFISGSAELHPSSISFTTSVSIKYVVSYTNSFSSLGKFREMWITVTTFTIGKKKRKSYWIIKSIKTKEQSFWLNNYYKPHTFSISSNIDIFIMNMWESAIFGSYTESHSLISTWS